MNRNFSPEEVEEMKNVTDLASNLSDGMKVLTAMNLARPMKSFEEPLPEHLTDVNPYVEKFLTWQLGRFSKPAQQALWSSDDALHDTQLYVRRKVWERKVAEGQVQDPVIRVLAVTTQLHRKYRADVHEALNHAVKHNENLKQLRVEMAEQLDAVVAKRLEETTERIAGAVMIARPEVKAILEQRMIGHE